MHLVGEMAEHQMAPRGQHIHQLAHQRIRLLVLDEVQDRHQQQGDRLVEVEGLGGLFEDVGRAAQVGVDVVGTALGLLVSRARACARTTGSLST
jgi:hypothetical protein